MGVTFRPTTEHLAESFAGEPNKTAVSPALTVLKAAADVQPNELLQSSLSMKQSAGDLSLITKKNGFVWGVVDAYNHHRALVIRPDDVWLAILSQFSLFVNANAEDLRHQFVAHEGKKTLTVYAAGTRYTVDFGHIAQTMTTLIGENVVDPTLLDWILPKFSTTTLNDTTVCAVVMMATFKAYFTYRSMLACGIPCITIAGEKSDWLAILERVERLKEYGPETTAWHNMLVPVLSRFVAAFDEPSGEANLDFFRKIAHYSSGSGMAHISGWLTAFCVWNKDGKWVGPSLNPSQDNRRLPPARPGQRFNGRVELDGVSYHRLSTSAVPPGFAEVEMDLIDNGVAFKTKFVAGSVGYEITSSGDTETSATGELDTVQPLAAWWIYIP